MFDKQKNFFFSGGSVVGFTKDSLLVFLTEVLKNTDKRKLLFLSESDSLNRELCKESVWFERRLVYYPEKETKKTVPGFTSQYNRYRSNAIIKIGTLDSICCLSTSLASKKKNINKRKKPVVFKIAVGDNLDRDRFIKKVLDLGYGGVDTVFKAGDISIKGDVVDVFPIYEKEPIRVSFDFNNIDSISFFNIDSQRSVRAIQVYSFWDVFGKEVELGRSLDSFVAWDSITNIVEDGRFFSILQPSTEKQISAEIVPLDRKIRSRKDFLSFLAHKPKFSVYLFYTNKKGLKSYTNKKVFPKPGKINNPFFIKESGAFCVPFWKDKHKKTKTKKTINHC